jgi:hypothetical protein
MNAPSWETRLRRLCSQDHQAHIATHQAFMQDPHGYAALIGQNPDGEPDHGSLYRHTLAEHTAFLYRQQMKSRNLGHLCLRLTKRFLGRMQKYSLHKPCLQAAIQLTQQHQQAAAAQQQAQQQAARPNHPDAASRATVEASRATA